MNSSFEYTTSLQYWLRAADTDLQAFRAGKKYLDMEEQHQKTVRALERRIKELEKELAWSHCNMAATRENWFKIFEELEKKFNRELSAARKKAQEMEKGAFRAEAQRDEALDKVTHQRHRTYETETELEEEKGKNRFLQESLYFLTLQRRSWKTRILKRHQRPL